MEINGNWISDVQVSLGNGAGESPAVFGRGAGSASRHVPAALCSGIRPAAPGGRAAGAAGPLLSPAGCACCWVTLCFLGEEKYRRKISLRWGCSSGKQVPWRWHFWCGSVSLVELLVVLVEVAAVLFCGTA